MGPCQTINWERKNYNRKLCLARYEPGQKKRFETEKLALTNDEGVDDVKNSAKGREVVLNHRSFV